MVQRIRNPTRYKARFVVQQRRQWLKLVLLLLLVHLSVVGNVVPVRVLLVLQFLEALALELVHVLLHSSVDDVVDEVRDFVSEVVRNFFELGVVFF